ncbi:MAG TPA: hypothetical protein VN962_22175 [Polyangia bacterium]|nr:hypothetical protein [Polyangia bacterium]
MTDVLLVPGEGWITPIPAWRATIDERGRALKTFEAARVLADLRRNSDRRSLALLYRVATGFEPSAPNLLREATLVAAVEAAVARGELLLLRADVTGRPLGARSVGRSPQDQLIDGVTPGGVALAFEGRRYRFTPAAGWSRAAGSEAYVAVRVEIARELVTRMEGTLAQTPADHAAWQALAAALTDPQRGTGVLMLREKPPASAPAVRPDVPVVTPSQLAPKIAEQDWIELQLEWDDGTPFDENFLLTLPGGRTIKGSADAGGLVRVDGLHSGDCKLTFPDRFPEASA